MRIIFLLLIAASSFGQRMAMVAGHGPGGADTSAPRITTFSTAADTVVGTTGSTSITVQFTGSKTLLGFLSSSISKTNCSVSGFTAVSGTVYTATLTPSSNGTFSAWIPAGAVTDVRGTGNVSSDTLHRYFSDASGYTYNLQLATITKSLHYRLHTAAFSDNTDLEVFDGGELMMCKYNQGATMNSAATNATWIDIYKFSRCDIGLYTYSYNYNTVDGFVTTDRQGHPGTSSGYGSGLTTYSASMIPIVLYSRDSRYETFNQSLPFTYATGITATNFSSRGLLFRWDYYAEATNANFYLGTQAQGDAKINTYVDTVVHNNGWYTNFVHWHRWVADYPTHYFDKLNARIGAADVWRGAPNQVAEYYYMKEAVDSVVGTGSQVTVYWSKKFGTSPYTRITIPLWLKLDLGATGYAGHGITTTHGGKIRSMGSDVYGISVPIDFSSGSSGSFAFNIYVTPSPSYIDLTVPTVTSRVGNVITTDRPTMMTLFKVHKPTSLTTSVSSNAIPTVNATAMTFTVATGLTIAVNATLLFTNDATHYFTGIVTSYNSGTGALVIRSGAGSVQMGTGTFSSWTIQNYFHYLTATLVERNFTVSTTHTIAATLDTTNYYYQVGVITSEQMSSLYEF